MIRNKQSNSRYALQCTMHFPRPSSPLPFAFDRCSASACLATGSCCCFFGWYRKVCRSNVSRFHGSSLCRWSRTHFLRRLSSRRGCADGRKKGRKKMYIPPWLPYRLFFVSKTMRLRGAIHAAWAWIGPSRKGSGGQKGDEERVWADREDKKEKQSFL